MDATEKCPVGTMNKSRLTNRWSYHPERQLLEWLSSFHIAIMELVKNNENIFVKTLFENRKQKNMKVTFEQIERVLKKEYTIYDLENNTVFNVFCKLSEALDSAHHSSEVSTFQRQDIQDTIAKVNTGILHMAIENLNIDQLEEYFLYDPEDHKSLLVEHISETCYTGFRYWESLLEHEATDHFLNKVTPTRKLPEISNPIFKHFCKFLIKLLIFFTSPICGMFPLVQCGRKS